MFMSCLASLTERKQSTSRQNTKTRLEKQLLLIQLLVLC